MRKNENFPDLRKAKKLPVGQNFAYRGKAVEIIAKKIGVSHELLRQAIWLMEHATKAQLEKLRNGEKSISGLYRELKNKEDKRKVTRRVTEFLEELLTPPRREGVLEIKKYVNTHFVNVMVEKPFYEDFENASSKLGVSTENSMLKALEDYHEKMKKALTLKKRKRRRGSKNEKRQNSA